MLKRLVLCSAVVLSPLACDGQEGFRPGPDTYSQSRATIGDVAGLQTIASIDSTFFGRNLPMLGRQFISEDYAAGSGPVAVLSHAFWTEHLGERPEVIGSGLAVGDGVRTIVGVMPQGVDVPPGVALWIPRK